MKKVIRFCLFLVAFSFNLIKSQDKPTVTKKINKQEACCKICDPWSIYIDRLAKKFNKMILIHNSELHLEHAKKQTNLELQFKELSRIFIWERYNLLGFYKFLLIDIMNAVIKLLEEIDNSIKKLNNENKKKNLIKLQKKIIEFFTKHSKFNYSNNENNLFKEFVFKLNNHFKNDEKMHE